MRAPAAVALVVLAGALAACTDATVVRVIDGREVSGRFVSARAYALYARGAEAEARGELEGARLEYLAAADDDSDNVEIWTRVGAVSCALGRAADAQSAFGRAAERAGDYEPLFRERAACALARGPLAEPEAKAAFDDAARALELDPSSEEAALLYARAAEGAGDHARAEKALRELVARAPGRVAGWRALRAFAERQGNTTTAARAAQALSELGAVEGAGAGTGAGAGGAGAGTGAGAGAGSGAVAASDSASPLRATGSAAALDEVDAAIARDALDEARSLAKRAKLAPAELAVRAAALGHARLARAQAELVFRADPGSASGAIALAVAADLLREDAVVVQALSDAKALTTAPSPLARLVFAELIARRTDREAARAFLGPISAPPAGSDALLLATSKRVATQLQQP